MHLPIVPALAGVSTRGLPMFSPAERGGGWAGGPDATQAGAFAEGLLRGTLVATGNGWLPVDELQPGDRVITLDSGLQPVRAIRQSMLWTTAAGAPVAEWPLVVPARALGNRTEMMLMPSQRLLIESDEAEAVYGHAFILLAARAFDGYRGIHRVAPPRQVTLISLEFEDEQLVYVNGTMLVHCRGQEPQHDAATGNLADKGGQSCRYRNLTALQGRDLIQAMHPA